MIELNKNNNTFNKRKTNCHNYLINFSILTSMIFLSYLLYESVKPIKGCDFNYFDYMQENSTMDITDRRWSYFISTPNGFEWKRCLCPIDNINNVKELYDLIKNKKVDDYAKEKGFYYNIEINICNFRMSDETTIILKRKPPCNLLI